MQLWNLASQKEKRTSGRQHVLNEPRVFHFYVTCWCLGFLCQRLSTWSQGCTVYWHQYWHLLQTLAMRMTMDIAKTLGGSRAFPFVSFCLSDGHAVMPALKTKKPKQSARDVWDKQGWGDVIRLPELGEFHFHVYNTFRDVFSWLPWAVHMWWCVLCWGMTLI